MKWPLGQAQISPVARMGITAHGLGAGSSTRMSGELSQSSIRARWRRGCSPSTGRNRSHGVALLGSAPDVSLRDHRLWTALTQRIARRAVIVVPAAVLYIDEAPRLGS